MVLWRARHNPEEKHDSLVAARDEVLASRSFAAESGTLRSLRVGVRRVRRITGPARDEHCTRGGETRSLLRYGAELLVRVSKTVSVMSYTSPTNSLATYPIRTDLKLSTGSDG